MRFKIVFFCFLSCCFLGISAVYAQSFTLDKKPEFFTLHWEENTVLKEVDSDLTIETDSIGKQPIKILIDTNSEPVLYTSNLTTPVCADGECKFMHIKMYWSLLGNYVGFDRFKELPLTKHDHDEFLEIDYQKLHLLLQDKNSILKRRKIDELVKSPEQLKLEGIDALSGATLKEVKESVVEGALYSCYVAWHLAHGRVREDLKAHTTKILTDGMLVKMLQNNNLEYQMLVLNTLNEQQFIKYINRISNIFQTGTPLIRTQILKNLPASIWKDRIKQHFLWDSFSNVDIDSRTLLLYHLETASKKVILDLSNQLGVMTKNQLKSYLWHLESLKKIDSKILKNLQIFAKNQTNSYGYLAEYFLSDLD